MDNEFEIVEAWYHFMFINDHETPAYWLHNMTVGGFSTAEDETAL